MTSLNLAEFKIADTSFQQANLITYVPSGSNEVGYCLLLIRESLCFFDLQGSLTSKISIPPYCTYLGSFSNNLSIFIVNEDKHNPQILVFDHTSYSFDSVFELDFVSDDIFDYPFYAARNGLTNLSLFCHPSLHGSILHYYNFFDYFIGHSRLSLSCLYSDLDASRILLFQDLFPCLTIYDIYSINSCLMISATDNSLFFPSCKSFSYVFCMDIAGNLTLLFGHDIQDSKFDIYKSAFPGLFDAPLWPLFCSSFLGIFECSVVILSCNQTTSSLVYFNPLTFACEVKKTFSHISELSLLPFTLHGIDYSTRILYRSAANPLSFFEFDYLTF